MCSCTMSQSQGMLHSVKDGKVYSYAPALGTYHNVEDIDDVRRYLEPKDLFLVRMIGPRTYIVEVNTSKEFQGVFRVFNSLPIDRSIKVYLLFALSIKVITHGLVVNCYISKESMIRAFKYIKESELPVKSLSRNRDVENAMKSLVPIIKEAIR